MIPLVVAHRGAAGEAPENTLAAFRLAGEFGAGAVELDVQLSRDGTPVVIHDADVSRTTDGAGPVRRFTVAELRRLDAGSWFAPQYRGEKIPLLQEVLELPAVPVIELKVAPGQSRLLAERVAELLGAYGRDDAVVICGTSEPLRQLERLAPGIRSLSFAGGTLTPAGPPAALAGAGAFSAVFAPPAAGLAGSIRRATGRGAAVFGTTLWVEGPWEEYLPEQVGAGLTGVFTDDPAELREWLERLRP